jgi:hypothetical protein
MGVCPRATREDTIQDKVVLDDEPDRTVNPCSMLFSQRTEVVEDEVEGKVAKFQAGRRKARC